MLVTTIQLSIRHDNGSKSVGKLEITNKELFWKTLSKEIQKEQTSATDHSTIWRALEAAAIKAIDVENKASGRTGVPRKAWLSLDTLKLLEESRKIKNQNLHNAQVRNLYQQINKDIQRSCRGDRNNYYDQLCRSIQYGAECKNFRQLFRNVRADTGQPKLQNWNLLHEKGRRLNNMTDILNEWSDYCGGLFDDSFFSPTINNQAITTE